MTKKKSITLQKAASVLVILYGLAMLLTAFLEIGGFAVMRLAVLDVELGAKQISELLMTMGVFSLVLAIESFLAGIWGFRSAAKDREGLKRCFRAGLWTLVVLVMYYAFLFVVDTLDPIDFIVAVVPVFYMAAVVVNGRVLDKKVEGQA
ncbi:hypothetical protein [Eubacterium sp. 1001713B170207_170306_E7]|uniref:hypothetical protein n=1 Tax=Eubacterium sp. 1001713B170207_170306_E7 TaxID=2787097 RepID=UPI0018981E00|nr:hypothetical protein [Eubacterium sp. 1001713B170207_170306_E7]